MPQQEAGPGQSDRPSPAGSSSSSVAGLRGAWATNSLHQQPLAEDAGQPLPPADLPAIRTAWDEEPAPQPAIRSFTDAASSSSSWAGDRGSRDGSSPPGASPLAGAVQLSAAAPLWRVPARGCCNCSAAAAWARRGQAAERCTGSEPLTSQLSAFSRGFSSPCWCGRAPASPHSAHLAATADRYCCHPSVP